MIDTIPTPAARPPAFQAQLKSMRESAAASLKAQLSEAGAKPALQAAPAQDAAPTAQASDPAAQAEAQRRQAAKDHARQRVLQLVEQVKTLKQFATDNPEVMAKQLARLAKELKSALAAYAEAGGRSGAWSGALSGASAPAASGSPQAAAEDAPKEAPEDAPAAQPAPSTQDVYRQMRDRVAGSEIASDMDFVKLVRGLGRQMRDLLNTARIKTGVEGPGEEMRKDAEDTETTLKEIDTSLDTVSRAIQASSPEAGLFVALYA